MGQDSGWDNGWDSGWDNGWEKDQDKNYVSHLPVAPAPLNLKVDGLTPFAVATFAIKRTLCFIFQKKYINIDIRRKITYYMQPRTGALS